MSNAEKNLSLPKILYIETTNRCNLRCKGCILYHGNPEPERDFTLAELIRITDQLPNLERVYLHGIGEPLLNQDLPAMIGHLKSRQTYVLFNSNGILLDQNIQRELVTAGLDELRISLDAASSIGYKKIRSSDRFEQIVENLKSLRRLQQQLQVDYPILSLWFLGTRENIFEFPGLIKLAAEIGIEEVHLQRLVYFQDDPGFGVARASKTLQDSSDGFPEILEESQELAARLDIRLDASGKSKPLKSLQGEAEDREPWRNCYRPLTLMYVTANGNVLPCCISPFATVDYDSLILGNVFDNSLQEIWSGTKYAAFRQRHQSAAPPKCCRGCGIQWSL